MRRYDRRRTMGRGRRRMRGRGIMDFLSGVNNFLKSSKIISTVAGMVPGVGQGISAVSGSLGYGRRVGRPCKGRGRRY